jgi:hypothetical protein
MGKQGAQNQCGKSRKLLGPIYWVTLVRSDLARIHRGTESEKGCLNGLDERNRKIPLLYNGNNLISRKKGCEMEPEGVVQNGVIVPDNTARLAEGTRVRITIAPAAESVPFGVRYAQFKGAISGLPVDLAEQHDHYRLGTPKG